jgi:8-oxo-dGTP pyrophosphatase MutT (NUDIX family)
VAVVRVTDERDRDGQKGRVLTYVVGSYIVRDSRVLLMFHDALRRWVPPGGRIDVGRGELPHEAALRKTAEETGLELTLLPLNTDITVEDGLASVIPQPLLLQLIDRTTEYYLDFAYVGITTGDAVSINYNRARAYHWFTVDDLARYPIVRHVAVHAERALALAGR